MERIYIYSYVYIYKQLLVVTIEHMEINMNSIETLLGSWLEVV